MYAHSDSNGSNNRTYTITTLPLSSQVILDQVQGLTWFWFQSASWSVEAFSEFFNANSASPKIGQIIKNQTSPYFIRRIKTTFHRQKLVTSKFLFIHLRRKIKTKLVWWSKTGRIMYLAHQVRQMNGDTLISQL